MSDIAAPLMPKATAVWLVDNTSLTFDQVADFCGLHVLEVKGIADGDVAHGIRGMDPITSGQLSRDEIEKAQADPNHRLQVSEPKTEIPVIERKRSPRYTPLSRRQDRPNAILWLLRNHPELKDSQVMRLVGTTKPTIQAIRDRTHWNSPNLQPADPVTLSLCGQIDLDREVERAGRRVERERKKAEKEAAAAGTLLATEETTGETPDAVVDVPEAASEIEAEAAKEPNPFEATTSDPEPTIEEEIASDEDLDADSVFAKLKALKIEEPAESEGTDDGDSEPSAETSSETDAEAETKG